MPDSSRVALVTGASRGIGRAIALALARDGFETWINYRVDEAGACEVAAAVRAGGGVAELVPFDVSDPEAIAAALGRRLAQRPVHALVANAGQPLRGPALRLSPDDLRHTLAVNLESFFHLVRTATRGMLRARCGRIVAVSSIAGLRGMPGQAAYAAAKGALHAAVRSLAQELAPQGILVNAVAPGFIDTEINRGLPPEQVPSLPLRRPGTPGEVAEVVAFLCSDRASYVSGAVVPVTGADLL